MIYAVLLLTRQRLQTVTEYNWNLNKAPMLIGNQITLHKHFSTPAGKSTFACMTEPAGNSSYVTKTAAIMTADC